MKRIRVESKCVGCDLPCTRCGDTEITDYSCDQCGREATVRVDDKDMCVDCAYKALASLHSMMCYVDMDKGTQVDFYLNWELNCTIKDADSVSLAVIDLAKRELKEYPSLESDLQRYLADEKKDFLEFKEVEWLE